MNTKNEIETLDSFVRAQTDQELKGLLLKLKNEIRKEDTLWEDIKDILNSIDRHDNELLGKVVALIIAE